VWGEGCSGWCLCLAGWWLAGGCHLGSQKTVQPSWSKTTSEHSQKRRANEPTSQPPDSKQAGSSPRAKRQAAKPATQIVGTRYSCTTCLIESNTSPPLRCVSTRSYSRIATTNLSQLVAFLTPGVGHTTTTTTTTTMRLHETVFFGTSVAVAATALLLAVPFPRALRVVLSLYVAPFVVFAAGVVYCVTVAAPFLDSVAWFVDGTQLRTSADPARLATANQDLYKGLLALTLTLSLTLQRMHVSGICDLQERLRFTKLNLDMTLKQAKGMSAASLSMIDQLSKKASEETSDANNKVVSPSSSSGQGKARETADECTPATDKLEEQLKTAQADVQALKAQSAALEREYQRVSDELESTKLLVPPALRGGGGGDSHAADDVDQSFGKSTGGAVRRRSRASKDD
jgi:hypothetical protein